VNLALWLLRAGKSDPHQPAIGFGERTIRSYGKFAERVARLAKAGDPHAVNMPGAVAAPLDGGPQRAASPSRAGTDGTLGQPGRGR